MTMHTALKLALFALCFLSALHSMHVYYLLQNVVQAQPFHRKISHIGAIHGLPITVDLQIDTPVLLRVEETVHFNYSTKEGRMEWSQAPPSGSGAFVLPKDHRALFVATYHQFHCVETFAKELVSTNKTHWNHLQHCLNFLRQIILCRPDLTLEEGDFADRNFTWERQGAVHTCRNWENIRAVVDANSLAWNSILENRTNSSNAND